MIAYAAAGTGGHIFPLMAIAEAGPPEEAIFLVTGHRDTEAVFRATPFRAVRVGRQKRGLWVLVRAFFTTWIWMGQHRLSVVVGSGCAEAFPVLFAALVRRIPIVLIEPNAIPGRVNRLFAPFASAICLGFLEAKPHIRGPVHLTGTPVRTHFQADSGLSFLQKQSSFLAQKAEHRLLVIGGSQGAMALNTFISTAISELLCITDILLLTGTNDYDTVTATLQAEGSIETTVTPNGTSGTVGGHTIWVLPFCSAMDVLYRWSTTVLCRSGAITLAEVATFHRWAVMVPFPYAKDNHQTANAKAAEAAGLGVWIPETALTVEALMTEHKTPPSPPKDANAATQVRNLLKCVV